MISQSRLIIKLFVLIFLLVQLMSCTAGSDQFSVDGGEDLAGFWYGLWHGAIAIITLIIHIFTDTVTVYETNNTGGWYDFGFLMGVIFVWGGGCHAKCKSAARKKHDTEWDEIGDKVEKKVMRKLKNWAESDVSDIPTDETREEMKETEVSKDDWDELWPKVEKKLKRKIREWAEKE